MGDCNSVVAMAETHVKSRPNPSTGSLEAVRIPDHLDILAKLACGAQLNMTVSAVQQGERCVQCHTGVPPT
jgi:hypothetical protein